MPSEPMAMMRSTADSGIVDRPQLAAAIGLDRLDDVADKARSCGRPGVKPGASSQHQTTQSAACSISSTL